MTIASLAKAAGVSPQTVYNSIGGKAAVVKAVYDVLLAPIVLPLLMRLFRRLQPHQVAY